MDFISNKLIIMYNTKLIIMYNTKLYKYITVFIKKKRRRKGKKPSIAQYKEFFLNITISENFLVSFDRYVLRNK